MRSFYHYVITFRDKEIADHESKLATYIFTDPSFPKQSKDYHDISDYLESHSPFPEALQTFDALWEKYNNE